MIRHLASIALTGTLFGALLVACATDTSTAPGTSTGSNPPLNCPSTVVAAPTAPACAKATQTCLAACQDETCFDNCFVADPNADACGECVEEAFFACVNTAGCQAAFDAQECCVAGCADPDSDECFTTTCATEAGAFEACAEEKTCSDAVCFAPM